MTESTIHIVDDDQAVRKSLNLLIQSAGMNAREYENGRDFLERYEATKPECLLLDLRMPDMDGMAVLRELQKRGINIATIFLSGHGDIPVAVRALREGALDFVEKPFKHDELLARLRVCVNTDTEMERIRIDKQEAEKRLSNLTRRERQVVDKLVEGKINKVIAHELDLSTRTVESHRARAMKKLGADSLSDVFKIALAAEGKHNANRHYIRKLEED